MFYGEERLQLANENAEVNKVQKLTDRVYAFLGFGSSNATLVVGEQSCTLIDAFDSMAYREEIFAEIEKITKKPVTTIIYTHLHPDHTGGAGMFAGTVDTIIAHRNPVKPFAYTEKLMPELSKRGGRQWGAHLSAEEAFSSGIGPVNKKGEIKILPPTQFIDDDKVALSLDGVEAELILAPGETDETMYIYLKEEDVLCCGDNYYYSWPNTSPIRSGRYRDVAEWIDSLDKAAQIKAEYLVSGHGKAVIGKENVEDALKAVHDALLYALQYTMEKINEGMYPEDIAASFKLPAELADKPFLEGFYGHQGATIRGIYDGYVGWFDGNPTHLAAVDSKEKAGRYIAWLGADKILQEAQEALQRQDMQWCAELCDLLIDGNVYVTEGKKMKIDALKYMGRMVGNANFRHYYLECAWELENSLK